MKSGKLSVNAMKRSVLGQIRTKREEVLSGAGMGRDCAIFAFPPEENAAVCVQEAVLWTGPERGHGAAALTGEDMGISLADLIVKSVNNLAAGGARPVAVMPALFLPRTMEESGIRELMAQAQEKCEELSIDLAGGQTRITAAVSAPLATVTAYGTAPGEDHSAKAAAPGQDIVLSKWAGLQGTAQIAKSCRERLLERYPAWLVEEAAGFDRYLSVLPEAQAACAFGVCAMHDASEGGILGALWELAEGAGVGLSLDLRKIPLRQETVEVCEYCGANPYELLSGGCLIMTAWDGGGLVRALQEAGIPAAAAGKLTRGNDRILTNGEEIRYLDRPQRDGIYQITRKERDIK
ncbi:MAG: hydrogenase maturation factor [Lachnospiraceae bacterium]|nr:hydrogenase maturation factor [Lachnospiraceae bacterium]